MNDLNIHSSGDALNNSSMDYGVLQFVLVDTLVYEGSSVTVQERLLVIESEQAAHSERLTRMEKLMDLVIESNNKNAIAIGHLAEKIDRFVDAVFHSAGNGKT